MQECGNGGPSPPSRYLLCKSDKGDAVPKPHVGIIKYNGNHIDTFSNILNGEKPIDAMPLKLYTGSVLSKIS